ncbi:nickel-responsive transcriptional regulator NikR [uncultured Campylobacter sp.]|uniref:nickel-responsive transcriptional regulator NikR n=1 Tax=uncultured Campylobacter sp. TaxID=218934 RepID=UPI00262C2758|nr:nickel-responsive transcriptional regulator NikR [uncultured Campylobacter sp.]
MDQIIRYSVSLTKDLLKKLDELVIKKGYASRSELTRDLIRKLSVESEWEMSEERLIGVLTIIYDHHQNELVEKKMNIEHDAINTIEIVCTTHVHIDARNCLETSILKGKGKDILKFADKIRGLKSVKLAELSKIGIPDT